MPRFTTYQELVTYYGLDSESLNQLSTDMYAFLEEKGIKFVYKENFNGIGDIGIYKIDRMPNGGNEPEMTFITDGENIFLYENMELTGGICIRLFDILHIGCGHLWQWSAGEESKLSFWGETAWKFGAKPYEGVSAMKGEVLKYETEAACIAMKNLARVLKKGTISNDSSEKLRKFFHDFLNNDVDYITDLVDTGRAKCFLSMWKTDTREIPDIDIEFKLSISCRNDEIQKNFRK